MANNAFFFQKITTTKTTKEATIESIILNTIYFVVKLTQVTLPKAFCLKTIKLVETTLP
jgi:hypothetical protein